MDYDVVKMGLKAHWPVGYKPLGYCKAMQGVCECICVTNIAVWIFSQLQQNM